MDELYSVKCVNNGKPFKMPVWTVEKHEELLEKMVEYDQKKETGVISEKEYDRKYRMTMMMISLSEIDKNLKEKDLEQLHPDDFIELWMAVYYSGKTGIRVKSDFQQGEQSPQQK